VDRDGILKIDGFGPVLAKNLTEWRDEVLKRFHFNPATDVSPAEKTALVVRNRTRQQQLLTQSDECCSESERLAATLRKTLDELDRQLRSAASHCFQADADHRLISEILSDS